MIPLQFIVWDTHKSRLWVSPRGRATWAGPGHARSSWEVHTGRNFTKQSRYQVHEATLVRGMVIDTKEVV
jgi:hypothetical protein